MALSRRTANRFNANIWPGFVDAMTALLLVLTFVLSIFMIVQFVLRETISGQGEELDSLNAQMIGLAEALGLEEQKSLRLQGSVNAFQNSLRSAEDTIDSLQGRLANFEQQVAGLLAQKSQLELDNQQLAADNAAQISEKEAVQLALAQARSEIDKSTEEARLAAAKRDAMEALIADLNAQSQRQAAALSDAEKDKLTEMAAAEALRKRLSESDAELSALTLALEAKRKEAEETLTLLAAAKAAQDELENAAGQTLSEKQKQAALLAQANRLLATQKDINTEGQRKLALLNQQTLELRQQLNQLQGLLEDAQAKDIEAQVQIQTLGSNLNAALARTAAEQKKLAALEKKERERLEAEAKDLEKFRSEFFGRVRDLLEGQEGVRMVGDRFVFSSEVLFDVGSADLGAGGQRELQKVAGILSEIADEIPSEIDWILRVDGHTDVIPISGNGAFKDNWELSQARALSVVKYLINPLGIPANRLAANGFGEFQPIDPARNANAYALNRRIELKFTEK
ncbi:flagellar motor protein [Amylibacter ulvae]|uniref:Flagellar motor protein n=1 Tax=Paramylibacter ulvae TaxID=1651968 RepID=A0ABQ3D0E4_9RHOB|nr:peptidoglycan -binding protein [Amylibacter ulvae]GHA51797.1 flagellar motor protein [Amylibacter ulvae]